MLNRLHTFCVIVEEGSFRKAAAKLFLSQPSVSQQITQLEKQLQIKLFERSGHKATLSPGGKTLYALAQEILAKTRSLPEVLADYRNLSVGTLELGTTVYLGTTHLSGILKKFTETFPSINVNISHGTADVLFEALERGTVEIAIAGRDPNKKANDRITLKTIYTDPLILVGSPHIVRHMPPSISTDDLEKFAFIGYTSTSPLYTFLNDFAIRNQLKYEKRILVDEPAIAVSLAAKSIGLALVSRSSVREDLGRGSLVDLKLPELAEIRWEIQVAYHTYRGLSYAGWMLLRHIQNLPDVSEE